MRTGNRSINIIFRKIRIVRIIVVIYYFKIGWNFVPDDRYTQIINDIIYKRWAGKWSVGPPFLLSPESSETLHGLELYRSICPDKGDRCIYLHRGGCRAGISICNDHFYLKDFILREDMLLHGLPIFLVSIPKIPVIRKICQH